MKEHDLVLSVLSSLASGSGGIYFGLVKRFFCRAAMVAAIAVAEDLPVRVMVRPTPAYVEHAGAALLVNCDFIAENKSKEKWTLSSIQVSVDDEETMTALSEFSRSRIEHGKPTTQPEAGRTIKIDRSPAIERRPRSGKVI